MARGTAGAASRPPPWMPRNDLPSVVVPMHVGARASVENRQSLCQAWMLREESDCSCAWGWVQTMPESEGRLHRMAAALTIRKRGCGRPHRSAANQGRNHMQRPGPTKAPSRTEKLQRISVEPLLPVPIPHTSAKLARGIRAGRWVFATGQCGTDYVNGIAPGV